MQESLSGEIIDDFQILEEFSHGGFSHVYLAKHIPTFTYCTAKVVNLDCQTKQTFNEIMREISVFMQVEHPNIATFFRLSIFKTFIIFFMDYLPNGTLLNYVRRSKGLKENEARRIFLQLFSALRYLHINHFLVHRDLKLENILLDKNNSIKLIDFGLSNTNYNNIMKTIVGTPGYQPPEVMGGWEYTEKCDIWSLGVCLYAMLTSSLPFTTQSHSLKNLLNEAQTLKLPDNISPSGADLLRRLLEIKPSKRPSLLELQSHPWLFGVPHLTVNLQPAPIVFYKVNDITEVRKFKRKKLLNPNDSLLEKCQSDFKINKDNLKEQLYKGLITAETTVYWILTNPLYQKPDFHSKVNTDIKKPIMRLPPLCERKRTKMLEVLSRLDIKQTTARRQSQTPARNQVNPISTNYRKSLKIRQSTIKSVRIH